VSYHDGVPSIASWIAAQKRNAQLFGHDNVFAVPHLIREFDRLRSERRYVLEDAGPVRKHA
jgi:hypothetical protein